MVHDGTWRVLLGASPSVPYALRGRGARASLLLPCWSPQLIADPRANLSVRRAQGRVATLERELDAARDLVNLADGKVCVRRMPIMEYGF